jgi:hypothetical protein
MPGVETMARPSLTLDTNSHCAIGLERQYAALSAASSGAASACSGIAGRQPSRPSFHWGAPLRLCVSFLAEEYVDYCEQASRHVQEAAEGSGGQG